MNDDTSLMMWLNSFLISATISSIASFALSLKWRLTNILPTAAAKLPKIKSKLGHFGAVEKTNQLQQND